MGPPQLMHRSVQYQMANGLKIKKKSSILSSLIASEVEQDGVRDFQRLIFYQHNVI